MSKYLIEERHGNTWKIFTNTEDPRYVRQLVAGNEDRRIWDLETGKLLSSEQIQEQPRL